MKSLFFLTGLLGSIMLLGEALAAGEQRFNLADFPLKERTVVQTDYWPSAAGEAAVCMWKDDKLAALSFTIDDNNASNVEWWLEAAEKYQVPLTWFIITGEIEIKKSVRGTWGLWSKVLNKGHAIESHTVTHLSAANDMPTWKGIDWEYAGAQEQIAAGLSGHQARFLAYPGGKNSGLNDPKTAARHYLAARSTKGMPNGATGIDYLSVNAMSKVTLGGSGGEWANLNNILDKSLYQGRQYGGWAVLLHHYVKPPYDMILPQLDFYAAHRERIWCGLFGDVARYGQERDTSTLTVNENTPKGIVLTLTDKMDDRYYDFALTVKVRLPDGWLSLAAQQNGKPTRSRMVEHDGSRYALVEVVPDRGDVVLMPMR